MVLVCIFAINHDSVESSWSRAARSLFYRTAKRGLSVFISDSRPAYPWRRGAEFELAEGGVGVLSTRVRGGGGWSYGEEDHTPHNMWEGL